MKIVTGAAGFIGSCIVAKLNELGEEDLFLVDHLNDLKSPDDSDDPKVENLKGKKYSEYIDKKDFIEAIKSDSFDKNVDCIIHMGACSSTTLQDAEYFRENNYEYTLELAKWAIEKEVRFIYASSAATYGDGSFGYKDDNATVRKCKPLNLYGESKQKFDEWVLDNGAEDEVVGLKFFNVFGPNEYHKGDMKSVVAKAYKKVENEGKMQLFKSYKPEYADGEQKRDFIYVKAAVEMVMFFVDNPDINGIYNIGTGKARTWNDLANALFSAVGCDGKIEYIDMPEKLNERYQYFTQADISKLRSAGYEKEITNLEEAVLDYSKYLKSNGHW